MSGDVFTVVYPGGRYVLKDAYPQDRDFSYPEPESRKGNFRRAVDSDILIYENTGEGDGLAVYIDKPDAPRGIKLDFYIDASHALRPVVGPGGNLTPTETGGRVNRARALAQAVAAVTGATALEFGPLTFTVKTGRILRRSPTAVGYKVTAEFLGYTNTAEFTDKVTGAAVPLI